MEFDQRIAVAAAPERVWTFLWDIEALAACIPGCREARVVEPDRRYEAVIGERIGPFKVQFPLQIEVIEADRPRRLVAAAAGRDHSVGSSLKLRLDLEIIPVADGQTELHLRTDLTILGKIASLGHGVIKRKADDVMTQFAQAVRAALEASPTAGATTGPA